MAQKKSSKKKAGKKTTNKKSQATPDPKPLPQKLLDKYEVHIERDVPLPPTYTKNSLYDQHLSFQEMEPGESFFLPEGWMGLENITGKMQSQCSRWNKYYEEEGRHFIVRTVVEQVDGNPCKGARVWRDDIYE